MKNPKLRNLKVPLNRILDLCLRFKAKVLSKGMHGLNAELKATTNGIACHHLAQRVDMPKMQDDKVAKINVKIDHKELKGVVLNGGSRVNVITEDTT